MSLMSEVIKDNFIHRNFVSTEKFFGNFFEKSVKPSSLSVYLTYVDSLSKCGKVLETLEQYDHCCGVGDISSDKLKHVTYGLIESIMTAFGPPPHKTCRGVFICGICESVLRHPTTIPCGHTFCRRCLLKDASRTCRKCDQKISGSFETNVLIKRLVEKFWSGELIAAEIREEGNHYLQRNDLEAAVAKYNEALSIVPDDHLTLCARSQAFCRMGKHQAAIMDAEHSIRLRPLWAKGHQKRGAAMLMMGLLEEALLSFCIYLALERNPQAVRHDIFKILQSLRFRHLTNSCPFGTPSQAIFRRARYFQQLSKNDCDEHSSGDEDFCECKANRFSAAKTNFYALMNHIFSELEKFKRIEVKQADLRLEPLLIDKSDFDCVLCCRTLWKPVTTSCGHTYCQLCLDRSLDYSSACPLCMKDLTDFASISPKIVTEFLSKILKMYLPGEYLLRQITYQAEISELAVTGDEKEALIPIFVCTIAYPSIHCPLFIYEPRYRLMIRQCIEAGTRQFGIAACFTLENGTRSFADFGTILEIKDWVLMPNGCSILSTVGVRRFRTLSRSERDGYETAKVTFLKDESTSFSNFPFLKQLHDSVREKAVSWVKTFTIDFKEQVVSSFGMIPEVEDDWASLPDGPSWTWWLLAILPLGPLLQVSILGTTSLEKRLRAIDKTLNQIQNRLNPQENYLKPSQSEAGSLISYPP